MDKFWKLQIGLQSLKKLSPIYLQIFSKFKSFMTEAVII